MKSKKIVTILSVLTILVACYFYFDLGQYLSLDKLKQQQQSLHHIYLEHPVMMVMGFVLIYIIVTGLSLPGATILTLAGGGVLGLWTGLVAVSFASTIGATCSFLVARTLLRDSIQKKFGEKLTTINEGVEREGAFYLFALRLVPAFPFFVINLVMGLTTIKTWTFYWVSQLGMLVGTVVYVNAGTQLATIEKASDIMTPKIMCSFIALGIFPLIAKKILNALRAKKEAAVLSGGVEE